MIWYDIWYGKIEKQYTIHLMNHLSLILLKWKKNRQHTSTKKAVDKNDLNTKRATANVATVTEILAIGLGTDSW